MKILLAVALSLSINSAFESGFSEPELLFPYTRAVQDASSPVCVINPAMIPFCGGFTATAAGGKPYYGYGLDSAYAAAQYGGSVFGLSARWNSFGDDAYRENSFCAGAGLRPLHWLGAGISADIYRVSIKCADTVPGKTLYDFGCGLLLEPVQWVQAGFMTRNIHTLYEENDFIYGEWGCGVLTRPCRGLSVSWNLTDNPAGKINTFIVTVNPMEYLSSGFGYSVESSSFSMNLGFMFKHTEFNYGLRFHPYLGYSHAVSITYSGSGTTESLAYGRIKNQPAKRINIKTATYDELTSLGFLSETSARRIVLYREQAGPLSRDALMRIGLTPAEIKMLAGHVYGFEKSSRPDTRDVAKKSGKNKSYVPRKVMVKRRFREMIDQGIPAYQAALYSEMCMPGGDDLPELLSADTILAEDQKKIIRRICGE